jgi:DNA-binding NarL/FixJ family response regulator
LDLGLPDCRGSDLVKEIVAMAVPVLVLTGARAPSAVLDAIRAGASGFLLKEDAVRHLVAAIDDVLGGHAPLSPDAVRALIDEVRAAPDSTGGTRGMDAPPPPQSGP